MAIQKWMFNRIIDIPMNTIMFAGRFIATNHTSITWCCSSCCSTCCCHWRWAWRRIRITTNAIICSGWHGHYKQIPFFICARNRCRWSYQDLMNWVNLHLIHSNNWNWRWHDWFHFAFDLSHPLAVRNYHYHHSWSLNDKTMMSSKFAYLVLVFFSFRNKRTTWLGHGDGWKNDRSEKQNQEKKN